MFKLAAITCLLFLSAGFLAARVPARPAEALPGQSADERALPSLSYCELIKSPELYAGKLIRLRASWRFGFETSALYDKDCPPHSQSWFEFADEKALCPQTKAKQGLIGRNDKEAEITVVGRLYGPGRYGHLSAYEFKFECVCLKEVKVTASETQ